MIFRTGDVVRLNSGGPRLTVTSETRPDGLVVCQWFGGDHLMTDAFDPAVIRLTDRENDVEFLAERVRVIESHLVL